MQKLLILSALLAVTAAVRWHQLHDYSFEDYKKEQGRRYESADEEAFRRDLFENEKERVMKHNKDTSKSWKEGINHFSDRTPEEFRRVRGLDSALLHSTKQAKREEQVEERTEPKFGMKVSLPNNVDWREDGIISAVKDQGDCGSCWTFATAETIEAYLALDTGLLTDLSEQQVLDCTPNPFQCGGTGGCGGGTVELAFTRINQLGGISTEWTYSYQSYEGANFTCSNLSFVPVVNVVNYTVLPQNELDPVMEHIGKKGPLAVSVDASAWSAYEEGVFNGCNQTNPDLDHAVQLVGYGEDKNYGNYWLVRNSWNPSWGEAGYIRIHREASKKSVTCGTDITPLDGDACKANPAPQTVCGTCGILYDTVYPNVKSIWN